MEYDIPFHDELLIYLYRQQNDWAFEALFERYHGFIRSRVLSSYYGRRLARFDVDECIQECEICFYQCTRNYCETRRTRFSTFVNERIHYCILNYMEGLLTGGRQVDVDTLSNVIADDKAKNKQTSRLILMDIMKAQDHLLSPLEKALYWDLVSGFEKEEIMQRHALDSRQYENAIYRMRKKIGFLHQ